MRSNSPSTSHVSLFPFQEVLQAGMHIPSGSLSQMTEEEHVRIAKRIGLIQHLPVGYYDGTGSRRHESSSEASKDTTAKPTNTNNQFNLTITEDSVCSECLVYFRGTDGAGEALECALIGPISIFQRKNRQTRRRTA